VHPFLNKCFILQLKIEPMPILVKLRNIFPFFSVNHSNLCKMIAIAIFISHQLEFWLYYGWNINQWLKVWCKIRRRTFNCALRTIWNLWNFLRFIQKLGIPFCYCTDLKHRKSPSLRSCTCFSIDFYATPFASNGP
jgi:hypothetical protein